MRDGCRNLFEPARRAPYNDEVADTSINSGAAEPVRSWGQRGRGMMNFKGMIGKGGKAAFGAAKTEMPAKGKKSPKKKAMVAAKKPKGGSFGYFGA